MSFSLQHLVHTFTGLTALLATVAGHAATTPDPAQAPSRMALRDACRDADDELQRAMGALVAQRGLEGTVRIDMELQGERIGAVSVAGHQGISGNDIRRAVRRLSCQSGRADRQLVSFEVHFAPDEAARRAGG